MPAPPAESKRPLDTKFKQQKLPAWKPILTPRTVLPTLFGIGIIFLAVGIALLVASQNVKEQTWDYTYCKSVVDPSKTCAELVSSDATFTNTSSSSFVPCQCQINISLSKGFDDHETFLYYALDNYYQNHRKYVKSRWDAQLRSKSVSGGSDCSPLDNADDGKPYAPCGLIANSLFNDTIELLKCTTSNQPCTVLQTTPVVLSGQHITWPSDRDTKFQNPDDMACNGAYWGSTAKPPNWPVSACNLGKSGNKSAHTPEFGSSGVGYENEDFIVWMRTAALPSFRKLYRRVLTSIPDGYYIARVNYNYPVTAFSGKKSIVLSTVSWMGGQNPFLGACYIVVGCVCLVIGILFVFFQRIKGRQLGDERFLKWDQE